MNRLYTPPVAEASGQAAELFGAIKSAAGKVPNAYATVGGNSPVALAAALGLDATLKKSSLNAQEIEVIRLAVSEAAACEYCLAAHTLMGKKNGLSRAAILGVRHGQPSGDARNDALANFARSLVTTRGTVAPEVLAAVREAAFSDAQIVDTALVIAAISFTNLVNRINDTTLDFPAAD
ncbi:carboxymuconolactone decarboxylase family protein [Collimonas sp.]|uniref:carboxymuconolactone decarboxylase family protein n=1 Tax=Collimonas sp. TaxID=1963772 RepID=UPI002B70C98F|nr:carboxymuconolactone decarboxylase family protein [Collimonas sp.]HWX03881.1 carboxymuconolactone decarboxylase family protein [Collimonas sp.]